MKTINKIALLFAGAAAAGYGVCCLADELLFNRKLIPPEKISRKISGCDTTHLGEYLENNLKWVEAYGYERHSIISDRGEKLQGYLMKPKEKSSTFIFCAHGYRSYGKKEFSGVAQYYIEKGYNVFFPDHVASGESEGTHCTFGYYEVTDCLKWLEYLTDSFGESINIILHGVSMGAATVMMMAGRRLPENVKGVIADCGYSNAVKFFNYKLDKMNIDGKNLIKAVNFVNKRRLGFSLNALSPIDSIKKATVPMLFIHGKEDKLVPCYMAYELYEACGSENKDILIVEGADHAQSYMVGAELYTNKMDEFFASLEQVAEKK